MDADSVPQSVPLLRHGKAVQTCSESDSIVAGWFTNHCQEIGPLWLTWHSTSSYLRYTECMAEWAEDLGIEPEQVEQLIFRRD